MNSFIVKSGLVAALIATSVAPAIAGDWEVWTEKQGSDKLTIVTSFAGNGSIEEAHIDLNIDGNFEVVDTQVLQKGSVCVASAEKNIIRSLPPSGAGSALKSKATDTCLFTIRMTSVKTWNPAEVVTVGFKECASSTKGSVPCDASIKMVK